MTGTSSPLEEGNIQFTFDSSWEVIKYDDTDIHRNGIMKLQGSKAVDFVGERRQRELFFIEVKDFRAYRIKNKKRITSGDLAKEVACKVRDTIAGLYGARRCNKLSGKLNNAFLETLAADKCKLKVVLWLEEDRESGQRRDIRASARHSVLLQAIKKKLCWLDSHVLVTSMQKGLPGVSGANLKGAGQGGGKRAHEETESPEPSAPTAAPARRPRRRRTKGHAAR